jgi:hypothetical protein
VYLRRASGARETETGVLRVAAKQRSWVYRRALDQLVESLLTKSAFPDPVSTINHLVESNPEMDLRDIIHLPVLQPLKTIVRMLTTNDAYLP